MTSKKKLRSLLGGTLFMVLMLSVHPTTVSASAVGSSTVMDQSVETEDQQSGIQSETQTQASQDSVAAVRASQNGWVKAGDGGWYFYENGQLKTGWLYRNGNWYWLDPDRNAAWQKTAGSHTIIIFIMPRETEQSIKMVFRK